jgi:putative transposase
MIRPAGSECLSDIMRWILSVFAMAYNRRMHKTGHVWGQRFFSRIILGFSGFLGVFRYLDLNPVEAGCVNNARAWRYGGLWMDRLGSRDFCSGLPSWLRLLFPEHDAFLLEGRSLAD